MPPAGSSFSVRESSPARVTWSTAWPRWNRAMAASKQSRWRSRWKSPCFRSGARRARQSPSIRIEPSTASSASVSWGSSFSA